MELAVGRTKAIGVIVAPDAVAAVFSQPGLIHGQEQFHIIANHGFTAFDLAAFLLARFGGTPRTPLSVATRICAVV